MTSSLQIADRDLEILAKVAYVEFSHVFGDGLGFRVVFNAVRDILNIVRSLKFLYAEYI